jgi:hypothetical protein
VRQGSQTAMPSASPIPRKWQTVGRSRSGIDASLPVAAQPAITTNTQST